jgi:BMFP domain-containing protein YqiC
MGSPMINDNLIRSLGEQLGRFVSDARSREDMQQSLNAIVQNVFARLDLVTREQFDAQLETLERTRAQLEHLETELARLQEQLTAQDSNRSA